MAIRPALPGETDPEDPFRTAIMNGLQTPPAANDAGAPPAPSRGLEVTPPVLGTGGSVGGPSIPISDGMGSALNPNPSPQTSKDVFNAAIKSGKTGEDVVNALNSAGFNGLAYYPDSGNYGYSTWYAAPDQSGGYFTVDRSPEKGTAQPQLTPSGDPGSSNMLQQILAELQAAQSGQPSPTVRQTQMQALTQPTGVATSLQDLQNRTRGLA